VTPCSLLGGCRRFGDHASSILRVEFMGYLKVEAAFCFWPSQEITVSSVFLPVYKSGCLLVWNWKETWEPMYVYRNIEAHSCNQCYIGKRYSECVYVAFGIQHMQCICTILSSVACPALQHFCTLSYKRYDLKKKIIEHKMFVSIFCVTFVWNIFHSKNWERCEQKCIWSSCKVPFILVRL